jgi:predicted nucleotide-binding protein
LTCFVSSPAGVDLTTIRQILLERDIEFLLPSEVPTHGLSISEKIIKLISRSDIFVAIFDEVHGSGNILFELGLAVGLKKQIIILAPPIFSLPSDLSEFLILRVTQDNLDAFGFSIDQMLVATRKKLKKIVSKKHDDLIINIYDDLIINNKSISNKNDDLIISNKIYELEKELTNLIYKETDYSLEKFVADLLKVSGISIIQQSEKPSSGADFAIWSDELGAVLGNPILIEIKRTLKNRDQAIHVTNELNRYIEKSNSKSAIVLYLEGLPSDRIQKFVDQYNILFFRIGDIVKHLRTNTFTDTIKIRRNIIAHGRIE